MLSTNQDVTVLIPARNAGETIGRCIGSLLSQGVAEILLIDDYSSDRTVFLAREAGGNLVRIIQPDKHINVPYARNAGLEALKTDFGVWCDADDAFLPGRVGRMIAPLRAGVAEVSTDGQELFDGKSGDYLRDLPIPGFLSRDQDKARLFERNFLPGIGHIAFRADIARQVRYDPEQFGGDDSDFLWRLIVAGARLSFIPEKGYRMYAYPGSDSRKIERQRSMVAKALRKHSFDHVATLYQKGGFSEKITAWGLHSMAIFREEYELADQFLERACPRGESPLDILEPEGPYPVPEGWRYNFAKGTLSLLMGEPEAAIFFFVSAEKYRVSADEMNNLGVALAKIGESDEAKVCFVKALEIFPHYLDAQLNLACDIPNRITNLPLRMQPSRCEY